MGCAQGEGSPQWRLRSNPISEHLHVYQGLIQDFLVGGRSLWGISFLTYNFLGRHHLGLTWELGYGRMGMGICEHGELQYGSGYTYLEHDMVSQELGSGVTAYEVVH